MIINTPDEYRAWRPEKVTVKAGKAEISVPCMNTVLVARSLVKANAYNPNHVPRDKMLLLRQSILDNGFCFPIVTIWDDAEEMFVIVDGFHRSLIGGGEWLDMTHLPIVVTDHDITKRMYATVQFNKARGVHQVDMDADIIRALSEQGNTDDEIAQHLGIDIDTVFRYKQLTGIADLFRNANYSMSWEVVEADHG